jgi:hypothetical protein
MLAVLTGTSSYDRLARSRHQPRAATCQDARPRPSPRGSSLLPCAMLVGAATPTATGSSCCSPPRPGYAPVRSPSSPGPWSLIREVGSAASSSLLTVPPRRVAAAPCRRTRRSRPRCAACALMPSLRARCSAPSGADHYGPAVWSIGFAASTPASASRAAPRTPAGAPSSPTQRGACKAGGSLRDVQELVGHRSIAVTQRYIDGDTAAKRRLVRLL